MQTDDSSQIARLSSTVAGMDHFQPIYSFIWHKILTKKETFFMFNKIMYFVDGKFGIEVGKNCARICK
jgi:hypothetical protein